MWKKRWASKKAILAKEVIKVKQPQVDYIGQTTRKATNIRYVCRVWLREREGKGKRKKNRALIDIFTLKNYNLIQEITDILTYVK